MTLHMDYQTEPGGSYETISIPGNAIGGFRLTNGYSGPRALRFRVHQASHGLPIGIQKFIRFWDDTGSVFSSSTPLFEGFAWDVQPDGNDPMLINYICYDPTHMVNRQVPVMSQPWDAGPPIAYATNAVPRLVVNVYQDSDDDFAIQRDTDVSIGGMIGGMLDDALPVLQYYNAAPAGGDAYITGGGSQLAGMTYIPQSKMVIENQKITSAVREVLTHYPNYRLEWIPGSRKWEFLNLEDADAETITLNLSSGSGVVLACDLKRTLDNTCTAVRIFGPASIETAIYSTVDESLTLTDWEDGGTYTDLSGTHDLLLPWAWQITDTDLRRGGRRLETDCFAPMGAYNFVRTRSPNLQLSWDGGTTWLTILNPLINFATGVISSGYPLFFYADPPPIFGSTQQAFPPNAARVVWASFAEPLSVRAPTSSFEGTAYTEMGIQCEEMVYDPTLAAGYEWGTPVTTETREEQFTAMAQAILDQRKSVIYTGVIVLHGLHYEYLHLNKKINIAAHDEDGGTLTTGWEDINAYVTDVEYDFEEMTTTLTINGDQMELLGEDPDELKQKIGIHDLIQGVETQMKLLYSFMSLKYSSVEGINVITGAESRSKFTYTDSQTGEQQ